MSYKITCWKPEGVNFSIQVADHFDPDTCPVCHKSGKMNRLSDGYSRNAGKDDARLQILFRCPRHSCGTTFIQEYFLATSNSGRLDLLPITTYPNCPEPISIAPEVEAISDEFSLIYKEADIAKQNGLDKIYGMALRKALEFLIKDYTILRNPGSIDIIKNSPLSNVISDYVTDPRLQACAKRAAWLGNDETHYTQKWESHTIKDLEQLIQLTMFWIQSEILTDHYGETMNPGSK